MANSSTLYQLPNDKPAYQQQNEQILTFYGGEGLKLENQHAQDVKY